MINRQSAFVISKPGSDLKALFVILEELGITPLNALDIRAGISLTTSVRQLIESCDFVIAILERDNNTNVFFELGMAAALDRRIAIIGDFAEIPISLSEVNVFHVGASTHDREALKFQLEAFITNARSTKRPSREAKAKLTFSASAKIVTPRAYDSQVEREVTELLEGSSEVASITLKPEEFSTERAIPDIAFWLSSDDSLIRNPVIVEIKGGSLSDQRILESINALKAIATSRDAGTSILLAGGIGDQSPRVVSLSPLIFALSLNDFRRYIENGTLVDALHRERNRFVHSAG